MRRASPTDIELVGSWYAGFVQEMNLPHPASPREWASAMVAAGSAFLWVDGTARSLACLSRETPNGRAIGPVYTPPATRRQGYATSLVAGLARQALAGGKRFVCLFTDADNPTSNRIYESIGFRFVCRYDAHRLVPQV
jgi:predicted GNAT family acetyltransferase